MRRFVWNFDASIHHLKSSLIIVALSCSWFGRLVLISVDDETCCACFIDEKKNCTRNSCIPSFGHLLCRIPNWLGEIIDSCVCLTNYLVERTKYQGKKSAVALCQSMCWPISISHTIACRSDFTFTISALPIWNCWLSKRWLGSHTNQQQVDAYVMLIQTYWPITNSFPSLD